MHQGIVPGQAPGHTADAPRPTARFRIVVKPQTRPRALSLEERAHIDPLYVVYAAQEGLIDPKRTLRQLDSAAETQRSYNLDVARDGLRAMSDRAERTALRANVRTARPRSRGRAPVRRNRSATATKTAPANTGGPGDGPAPGPDAPPRLPAREAAVSRLAPTRRIVLHGGVR